MGKKKNLKNPSKICKTLIKCFPRIACGFFPILKVFFGHINGVFHNFQIEKLFIASENGFKTFKVEIKIGKI